MDTLGATKHFHSIGAFHHRMSPLATRLRAFRQLFTMLLTQSQSQFTHPPIAFGVSCAAAKIPMGHLLRTLTDAIHSSSPLSSLIEKLGTQLSVDSCLLIGHHTETDAVTLSRWHPGMEPRLWQLSPTLPTEQASLKHQLALTLMQELIAIKPLETSDTWPESWSKLMAALEEPEWWQGLEALRVIPLNPASQSEGLILLVGQAHLTPELIDEIACLGTIALHQHVLQQQAQRSIDQLRYLNQLKDDFQSTLSHELRTPLTSMMLAIRMLRRADLTPERQAMYLDILEQQCSKEISLVNDLLTLRTLETGKNQVKDSAVDLNRLLKQLVIKHREQFQGSGLELKLQTQHCLSCIHSDAHQLERIIEELLTNARKYAATGTAVTATLRCDPNDEQQAVIQLSNLGCGINPDELPHIFEKFRRGQGITQKAIPGVGAGLALVQGLVKQLGGKISVTSQPCDSDSLWQTCFTLSLPLRSSKVTLRS